MAISLLVAIQLVLKTGMKEDPSWWKLVVIRAICQCGVSAVVILAKHALSAVDRTRHIRCTFSLRSHRWAYFCQTILAFVFVASLVEAVHRIPSSTLATIFHLIPIVIIATDVASAR